MLNSAAEYSQLAGVFGDFNLAAQTVTDVIMPLHSAFYDEFFHTPSAAIAATFLLIGVAYHMLRGDMTSVYRLFAYGLLVSILMLPHSTGYTGQFKSSDPAGSLVQTAKAAGKGQYSQQRSEAWSYYVLDHLTSAALRHIQSLTDRVISGMGPTGNFATPLVVLDAINKDFQSEIAGSGLQQAYSAYLDTCNKVAMDAATNGGANKRDWAAYGLLGGDGLGKDVPRSSAILTILNSQPRAPIVGPYKGGFVVEDQNYWSHKDTDQKAGTPSWIMSPAGSAQASQGTSGSAAADPYVWYPQTCGEMFYMLDQGFRQFYAATLTPDEQLANSYSPLDEVKAEALQFVKDKTGFRADAVRWNALRAFSKRADAAGDGIATGAADAVAVGAADLHGGWEGLAFRYWVFFLPASGALVMGLLCALYPIVVLTSLIPGREASLALFIKVMVFVKLVIAIAYLTTRFGGLVSLGIMEMYEQANAYGGSVITEHLSGLSFAAQVATIMFTMFGSFGLAYMLIFLNTGALERGFNKYGVKQLAEGIATLASSFKMMTAPGGARPAGRQSPSSPEPSSPKPSAPAAGMSAAATRPAPLRIVAGTDVTQSALLKRLNKE